MPSSKKQKRSANRQVAAAEQAGLPDLPDSFSRLSKGLFITFEGGEGTGKTTQATRLTGRLAALGLDVETAREPGATRLGEQIRAWVKRESETSVTAETLLFAAARAQLVADIVAPRLHRGGIIVLDRYIDSTIAYQGYARGMRIEDIQTVNSIATSGLVPDLTVFLDADPRTALDRVQGTPSLFDRSDDGIAERRVDREDEMRFERESIPFHQKVRQGYQELAKEGGRWCVVGADQAQHRVADAIWKRVRPLLIDRGVDAELLFRKQGSQSE